MNCVEAVGLEAFIAKKFYCFMSIIYLEKIIFDINIVLFPRRLCRRKNTKDPGTIFREEIAKIVISTCLRKAV